MTRFARVAFALLVVATFGAFFVAQRLKQSPRVARALTITGAFSPNDSGSLDRARIRFELKRTDDVTIRLIDAKGNAVRRLVDSRRVPSGRPAEFFWDGRMDDGKIAPDGKYRVRLTLRRAGRSVYFAKEIRLDTTPPRPLLFVTSPVAAKPGGPPVARPGDPVRFRFVGPTRLPARVYVLQMDDGAPKLVRFFRIPRGELSGVWDGRDDAGAVVRPGAYVIAVRLVDDVLNAATSPVLAPARPGHPRGRPGVTLRIAAVTAPTEPVRAGSVATFHVDTGGLPYQWQIRRLGSTKAAKARPGAPTRGRAVTSTLRVRAPRGISGVYFLDVTVGTYRTRAPLAVLGPSRRRVLVVLSGMAWQGRNPVADTDSGLPSTLFRGGPAGLDRPFAPLPGRAGVPIGFSQQEGPLLDFLDRSKLGYELTTDVALARGRGPSLAGHRGVILAGNPRWITPELERSLLAYVRGGGNVFSLGTASLRRTARIAGDQLTQPSAEQPADAFGALIRPITNGDPVDILAFGNDGLGLFEGTDGLFTGFDRYEQTRERWPGAKVESAAGIAEGQPIIVGARVGRGIVIRTGLPDWSRRLRDDANVAAMTRRAWTLISQ